jgi:cation:H+ antiporter
MSEFLYILQFIGGSIFLYFGAEYLIENSKKLASHFKISPIVVGITIVAFGTSLPELVVSILANFKNEPGIVLGNIIGSNIANIGLVLSITAIIYPIVFTFSKIKVDLLFLLTITTMPLIFIVNGHLTAIQGIQLFIVLGFYVYYLVKRDSDIDLDEPKKAFSLSVPFFIIFSITGLAFGSHFFVEGAIGITKILGVSSITVGMTIVAIGTSLPELATSAIAAKQGNSAFAIGNIIGSNIMNIVAVLGLTIIIKPIEVTFADVWIQLSMMLGLTMLLLIILRVKNGISKNVGWCLLVAYSIFFYLNFLQ